MLPPLRCSFYVVCAFPVFPLKKNVNVTDSLSLAFKGFEGPSLTLYLFIFIELKSEKVGVVAVGWVLGRAKEEEGVY